MKKKELYKIHSDTILDSISEGVFTVDNNFNLKSFNKAAEEITGYNKDFALEHKCFEIFKTSVCESGCTLRSTMKTGKAITDKNIDIRTRNEETIPVAISTAILKSHKGEIIGGVETFRDCTVVETLKKQIDRAYTINDIACKSHEMQKIMSLLPEISKSSSTVLLQGPSGAGKEVISRAIHSLSKRKNKPFVAINSSAIPENLLESELFGYVRGAFTDAKTSKPGKLKLAGDGTIFFDEIGDLSHHLQAKLLRVIQEREYEPLGATRVHKTDARLIFASNKNLFHLVQEGKFRNDLYYRVNVMKLTLPPLCKRKEDIPVLLSYFLDFQNKMTGKKIKGMSEEANQFILNYNYPGNIRELQNIIEHAFILCTGDKIEMKHLPSDITNIDMNTGFQNKGPETFAQSEAHIIKKALETNRWSRVNTARELDMNLTTLWRKMKKHNLF